MPNHLLRRFFPVFFLALLIGLGFQDVFSQGCQGADGTGIYNGSIANDINGTVCANQFGQPGFFPGTMAIDIRNVAENPNIQFQIDWNDGSGLQPVAATKIGPNRYYASVDHSFPVGGADVQCEYFPIVRLIHNGTPCAANLGTPPRFVRWNTDDENTEG
jgi:hypothetical protein